MQAGGTRRLKLKCVPRLQILRGASNGQHTPSHALQAQETAQVLTSFPTANLPLMNSCRKEFSDCSKNLSRWKNRWTRDAELMDADIRLCLQRQQAKFSEPCREKVTTCYLRTTYCILLTAYYSLLTAYYLLLTTHCLLLTTYFVLTITYSPLPTTHYLLHTAYLVTS